MVLEPAELTTRLEAFLTGRLGADGPVSVTDFEQITGGYSRYMARFTASVGGDTRRLILRADPPPGQSILETDRRREWEVLRAVIDGGSVTMPDALFFDAGDEIGTPAIILDEIPGDTLFVRLQTGDVADHFDLVEPLAALVADLHAVDVDSLPAELERPPSWDAYIDSVIEQWVAVEEAHVEADPFMRVVASWLDANRPPPTELTMVHGDLQPPNIIIDAGGGGFHMLDWELTKVGDPREDLGWWALACGSQPPDLIEAHADAFYRRYRDQTGLGEDVVNPATVAYFTVFSSLQVFSGVIGQTAKMSRGETTAMSIAYMTNAIPYMHGTFVGAMRRAGGWREEAT